MRYSNMFVTGCDSKTEWMLPWFIETYKRHNDTPIVVANFGMSTTMVNYLTTSKIEMIHGSNDIAGKGWFAKPRTMILASMMCDKWCWIDTDCQVFGDISGIFDHIEPGKIAMVEDKPWSSRRGETWHNSGVVAGEGVPPILRTWEFEVSRNPSVGDQEVLHEIVREGMKRLIHITDLPNKYNWLRLQVLDGHDDPNKLVMHHTGQKGKALIRTLIGI